MNLDNSTNAPGPGATQKLGFSAPSADTTLSEALITLRKRRLIIIACVVLSAIVGFYKALTQIKVYEAYGEIEVRSGSSDEYRLTPSAFFGDDPQRKMLTEEAILTSDALLATVGRDLNLANSAAFLGGKAPTRAWRTPPCGKASLVRSRQASASPRFPRPT